MTAHSLESSHPAEAESTPKGGFNVNEHTRKSRHTQPIFGNGADAFQRAIKGGALSNVPTRPNYAGLYMYMGTWDGVDKFKNINTRTYLGEG